MCKNKISGDTFDLFRLRSILLTKSQIAANNLERSLKGTEVCELIRISRPEIKSKHVVICCTGFNQQGIDQAAWWKQLLDHYKHAEVFAINWTALNYENSRFLSSGFNKINSNN